ncbi:MAG: endonuclease/exonuclease/phosphatase family protein [Acidimicrobiia bacterium]|nr:endonuclease/exonuclease/phosphatase family protein [Acidimicrobiia bacterium]
MARRSGRATAEIPPTERRQRSCGLATGHARIGAGALATVAREMDGARLRVCTFNIRYEGAPDRLHAWSRRRRSTAATLADIDADIIGLQEASDEQLKWLLGHLRAYRAVSVGRNQDLRGERCPILFRTAAFRLVAEHTLWYADDPYRAGARLPRASHPRIATFARLESPKLGTTIEVVNTHLDERHAENRYRSVGLLASWVDRDVPGLVLGDFNARPGPTLQPLLDRGYVLTHPTDAGPTFHGFGRRDGDQIDHILASTDWRVHAADVRRDTPGRRLPSDHWPVVADLELRDHGERRGP